MARLPSSLLLYCDKQFIGYTLFQDVVLLHSKHILLLFVGVLEDYDKDSINMCKENLERLERWHGMW